MRPVLRGKISARGSADRRGGRPRSRDRSLAGGHAFGSGHPRGRRLSPTVSRQFFGKTIEPYTGKNTAVYRYTLTNCRGMQVRILTYGAITQSIDVPSARGPRPTWCWASRR